MARTETVRLFATDKSPCLKFMALSMLDAFDLDWAVEEAIAGARMNQDQLSRLLAIRTRVRQIIKQHKSEA